MELFRGQREKMVAYMAEGECWTDSERAAELYAGDGGYLHIVDIDLRQVATKRVAGYNHETNETPADDPDLRAQWAAEGVDVVIYEDEDEHGRPMTTYRTVRPMSFASSITVVPIE